MDYTEIIEREAENTAENSNLDAHEVNPFIDGFINGLNSPLAKQIAEIEVVKGKIEVYNKIMDSGFYLHQLHDMLLEISNLEQLRDKLINELKLK